MLQIQRITNAALQQHTLVLPDGTSFSMTLYFIPMQYGWFITNLTYGTFVLTGMRISNSPNMLYQFQNILPFGLACFSVANREPSLQEDFMSGASKLYILTEAECEEYAAYIRGGDLPA